MQSLDRGVVWNHLVPPPWVRTPSTRPGNGIICGVCTTELQPRRMVMVCQLWGKLHSLCLLIPRWISGGLGDGCVESSPSHRGAQICHLCMQQGNDGERWAVRGGSEAVARLLLWGRDMGLFYSQLFCSSEAQPSSPGMQPPSALPWLRGAAFSLLLFGGCYRSVRIDVASWMYKEFLRHIQRQFSWDCSGADFGSWQRRCPQHDLCCAGLSVIHMERQGRDVWQGPGVIGHRE